MVTHGCVLPTRGVVLATDDSIERTARVQSEILELAERAETRGFDAVWVGDSVTAKPRLEPLSTLAAVAGVTDALTLGTAVYLPQLRHPLHVAHQTATVDLLSGGRLALGVGVGVGSAVAAEHEHLDVPYERRGAALDEGLDVLTACWDGEAATVDGEFYDLDGADVGLRPVGNPPPIYVASATFDPREGFPRRIRERLATRADGWMPLGMSPEMVAAGANRARSLRADADRDADSFEVAYYQDVVIADTEAAAIEQARSFLERYYPSWGELSDERIRRRGAFGPPSVVAEHLEAYADAGVDAFVTRFATADQWTQLERYADLVA